MTPEKIERARALRADGMSWRKIGAALDEPFWRIRHYVARHNPNKPRRCRDPNARATYAARLLERTGLTIEQWNRRRRWAREEAAATGEPVEAIYKR